VKTGIMLTKSVPELLLALFLIAIFSGSSVQAQPLLPSCGNIKLLESSVIDGRVFSPGLYQLNTFGVACNEAVGLDGILGVILSLGAQAKLPTPWTSLIDAVGAPKFSAGAGIGFRLQKIAELTSIKHVQEQLLTGITTSQNSTSSAVFTLGASANLGLTQSQFFNSSDAININATVIPQGADRGLPANIYVVAQTIEGGVPTFRSLGRLGNWTFWQGSIDRLVPAFTVSSLAGELKIPIYSGALAAGIKVAVYVGYATISEQKILVHYNSIPFTITVTQ
jgi:hypothetical protein